MTRAATDTDKESIWWRLTTPAAWLTACALAVMIVWRHEKWDLSWTMLLALGTAMTVPYVYLTVFCLWHWKYRYRGTHDIGWAIALAMFWMYAPQVFYHGRHIVMDRKGKGPYANCPDSERRVFPRARYGILRQTCLLVGAALLGWSAYALFASLLGHYTVFNLFNETLAHSVGKTLTAGDVQGIAMTCSTYRLTFAMMTLASASACVGGVLVAISQRTAWRLREQEDARTSSSPDHV